MPFSCLPPVPILIGLRADAERDPVACPCCGLAAWVVGISKRESNLSCHACRTHWILPTTVDLMIAAERTRIAELHGHHPGGFS